MLIQIESVTQTGQSETLGTQPGKAIITLTLIQGMSGLSISMLISTNKPPQLLMLPTRFELQPSQINELLMSSLITRLQALEASGAGKNTAESIRTPSTSMSVLQRLATRIRSFLTSHY